MDTTVNDTFDNRTGGKGDAWRRRIDAQRASGQSVRAWCKANNFGEHSFYWWRARLGLSSGKRRLGRPEEAKPAPLTFAQVVARPSATEPLRLRLSGQRELIFPASMPIERVARLIHAIEGTT
jgi:hypothetical protein